MKSSIMSSDSMEVEQDETHSSSAPTDPQLREKWFHQRLQEISDEIAQIVSGNFSLNSIVIV